MKGIDISMHNGNIDFVQVKNSGIEVVIIKATEGVNYIDPKFESYYNNAYGKGIYIGFYHFMSEKTDPAEQAVDFYNAIKNKSYNVLPCLDIESNSYNRSATEITNRCISFLNKFKELSGLDCMIYTGGYFGRDNLDSRIKGYPAWIAHYGVSTPMYTGFSNVVGHQYTDTGYVSGVGTVDMNNFTDGILINNNVKPSTPDSNRVDSNITTASNYLGSSYRVKLVQLLLNCFGFGLNPDGICGNLTTTAIGQYQSKYGLAKDYMFGPKCFNQAYSLLKDTLSGIRYTTPNPTKVIQHVVGVKIDGIFGNNTKNAVINFQKANGLAVDGVVGVNTWKKILV